MQIDLSTVPFNIKLLPNTKRTTSNLTPVTTVDIYDSNKAPHSEGLFSYEIFGRPGDPRRMSNFSYIDLGLQIMHPLMYKNISRIAAFYVDIYNGKKYATFNVKKKIFEPSTPTDGKTGSTFFLKHFQDLEFERNESRQRNVRIDLLDDYRSSGLYDFVLVAPAGYRDLETGKNGRVTQDVINDHYRSLIGLSNSVDREYADNTYNDTTRVLMQKQFGAIFDLIMLKLNGKPGRIRGKFIKRRVDNGTRSVITPMLADVEDLDGPQFTSIFHAHQGLYQTMKAGLPFVIHALQHPIITERFNGDGTVNVLDPKTLNDVTVNVAPKYKDLFRTEAGVNKLLNNYHPQENRDKPALIDKYPIALIYRDDKGFKIVASKNDIDGKYHDQLRPVTYTELYYYLTYGSLSRLPTHITRYPFANQDSTTPNKIHIKTTIRGAALAEYDDNMSLSDIIYPEMPMEGSAYMDTLSPHPSKLKAADGDHDGDF